MVAPDPPWEWRDGALCTHIDLDIIHLVEGEQKLKDVNEIFYCEDWEEEKVARAKKICAVCPVRAQCLDFAIGTRDKDGIWGGKTANERRSLINKMRRNKEPIPKYHIPMPRAIPDS